MIDVVPAKRNELAHLEASDYKRRDDCALDLYSSIESKDYERG